MFFSVFNSNIIFLPLFVSWSKKWAVMRWKKKRHQRNQRKRWKSLQKIRRKMHYWLKVYLTLVRHNSLNGYQKFFLVKSTFNKTKVGLILITKRMLNMISQNITLLSFSLMKEPIKHYLIMVIWLIQRDSSKEKERGSHDPLGIL